MILLHGEADEAIRNVQDARDNASGRLTCVHQPNRDRLVTPDVPIGVEHLADEVARRLEVVGGEHVTVGRRPIRDADSVGPDCNGRKEDSQHTSQEVSVDAADIIAIEVRELIHLAAVELPGLSPRQVLQVRVERPCAQDSAGILFREAVNLQLPGFGIPPHTQSLACPTRRVAGAWWLGCSTLLIRGDRVLDTAGSGARSGRTIFRLLQKPSDGLLAIRIDHNHLRFTQVVRARSVEAALRLGGCGRQSTVGLALTLLLDFVRWQVSGEVHNFLPPRSRLRNLLLGHQAIRSISLGLRSLLAYGPVSGTNLLAVADAGTLRLGSLLGDVAQRSLDDLDEIRSCGPNAVAPRA